MGPAAGRSTAKRAAQRRNTAVSRSSVPRKRRHTSGEKLKSVSGGIAVRLSRPSSTRAPGVMKLLLPYWSALPTTSVKVRNAVRVPPCSMMQDRGV
jgi:hypothetical protein